MAKELVLARTDHAAVAITGLMAYPTGFEFTLSVLCRREDRDGPVFDPRLHRGLGRCPGQPLPAELLRFGLRFSDGLVATNLDRPAFPEPPAEPTGPLLFAIGGGGDRRRWDMRHWVWPLPPSGPLLFVCQWPAHDIEESRAEIDAQLILDAATRAVQLWPEDDVASD